MASDEKPHDRNELAEARTDWAEDRTLLANERTFAGWLRTGMAAIGIGVGFHALFGKLEPQYLARGIASLFVLGGVFIFIAAARSSSQVCSRLASHAAQPIGGMRMNLIAGLFAVGGIVLLGGVWLIDA